MLVTGGGANLNTKDSGHWAFDMSKHVKLEIAS